MAWIAKNSGTATVERRETPYLSQKVREMISSVYLPRYETKRAALLPTLHAVQAEVGWLPGQALGEVAEFLGLTPAEVIDCASFYEEFWLRPKGEHVVWVCRSIACEVCDHRSVLEACRRKLNIEPGETTGDGKFTLMEVECLGSCGTAPVALIDHTLHENLTAEKIEGAIEVASKNGAGRHHH